MPEQDLIHRAVVALRGCVDFNGRHGGRVEQSSILDNKHIDTGMIEIPGKASGLGNLTVKEDSVESHMDPHAESMRIGDNLFYIRQRIGGGLARTKLRRTYIYSVSPVINRRAGAFGIAGWSEKLNDIARQMASSVRHKIKKLRKGEKR